jgi:hypothetical protein
VARQPKPPASEKATTRGAFEMCIIGPKKMGYLILQIWQILKFIQNPISPRPFFSLVMFPFPFKGDKIHSDNQTIVHLF